MINKRIPWNKGLTKEIDERVGKQGVIKNQKIEKYMDKEWLFNQYWVLNKTIQKIANENGIIYSTVRYWMIKNKIKRRTISETKMGKKNPSLSKRNLEDNPSKRLEVRKKLSQLMKGEKNHNWRGDEVGTTSLHGWVNRNKIKLNFCIICNEYKKTEMGNLYHVERNNKYFRNLEDFVEFCHSCHMIYDNCKKKKELKKN